MKLSFVLMAALALSACGKGADDTSSSVATSCEQSTLWYRDADADGHGSPVETIDACADQAPAGYVSSPTDCDDFNVSTNPDAQERCNELDDDCDLAVDEEAVGAPTWYLDADGDAAGDVTAPVVSCSQPSGYAFEPTDCDDHDARVNPWAVEICNDKDDDCDGTVDDPSELPSDIYYVDADGDGYGAGDPVPACQLPAGHTSNNLDCDDSTRTIAPNAAETCENGVDEDCDGGDSGCVFQWSGIRTNVATADLEGWTECYSGAYNATESLSTIEADCSGEHLLLACRQTGSATLTVAAHAPREDVLFDVGSGVSSSHDANGTSWYYHTSSSWGFFRVGDGVQRSNCDTSSGAYPSERLCWHTNSGNMTGGFRCGTTTGLNGSRMWDRVIYHADF
jgi:hypothetical protein